MIGPLINQPFVVKHVFSGNCIEGYYLIVVPNKLISVLSNKVKSLQPLSADGDFLIRFKGFDC